jgi:hypothetical protein
MFDFIARRIHMNLRQQKILEWKRLTSFQIENPNGQEEQSLFALEFKPLFIVWLTAVFGTYHLLRSIFSHHLGQQL